MLKEKNSKNCYHHAHSNIKAIFYCIECKIYLCNKCGNFHSKLYNSYHKYKIKMSSEKDVQSVKEELNQLEFEDKFDLELKNSEKIIKVDDLRLEEDKNKNGFSEYIKKI